MAQQRLEDGSLLPSGSPLDAAIKQLLKEHPSQDDSSYVSEQREQLDLYRLSRVHFDCVSGDTLVIVDFPSNHVNCKWDQWSSKRFCVHSEKLLATGSKVFADLLSPKWQARFRKRMENAAEPYSQKFVVDLTPSAEGDELAAQLMELSLPSGVRDWWTAKERLGISRYLVSGHDDLCRRHAEVPIECPKRVGHESGLPWLDLADVRIPASRMIDDYCPTRHRANIIRLILAIEGHDLVLNSAPRVFTLTAVANILDCTNVVRDSVCTWLMAEPNTEFVDINTEVAFRIAWTLKLTNVAQAAFRILVVEKALDALAVQPGQTPRPYHTLLGRPRTDLPDDLQTVVQYAAHKLVDRVQQTLAKLESEKVYEILDIHEYRKLMLVGELISIAPSTGPRSSTRQPTPKEDRVRGVRLKELHDLFTALSSALLGYRDSMIFDAMSAPPTNEQQRDFDRDRRCYVPRTSWNSTANIFSVFSFAQRLLTPWFWERLLGYCWDIGGPNTVLAQCVSQFNDTLDEVAKFIDHDDGSKLDPQSLHFDLPRFRCELQLSLENLRKTFRRPKSEVVLSRTRHLELGLSEDEFKYLPLWAGGFEDGTGGVFEPTVPDAELGPSGPGPAYHTGDTVATETSSIYQSDATPSLASTMTLTVGRSVAAVPSNVGPSITHDIATAAENHAAPVSLASTAASTAALSEEEDGFEDIETFYDSDEIDEEAWSQVEEP